MIGGRVGILFQIDDKCGRGEVWLFVYDINRPAFMERDLVGLCMNGNWQVWVQYCGGEKVSIHMVRKGTTGFSNVCVFQCQPTALFHASGSAQG